MRFWLCATRAVLAKEMRLSLRAKPAWATMALFSLVTIFILGFSTTGASPNSQLLAGFYWVTMFYATTVGLQGTFTDEATAGTLLALRMYGHSEAIFFRQGDICLYIITHSIFNKSPAFYVFLQYF